MKRTRAAVAALAVSGYYPARPFPWRPHLPGSKPLRTIRPPPRAKDTAVAKDPALATRVVDRLFLAVRWTFLFDPGSPADRWTGIVVSNRTVLDIVKGPPLK